MSLGGDVAVAGRPRPMAGRSESLGNRARRRRSSTRSWPSPTEDSPARPPRLGCGTTAGVTSTTSSTRGPGTAPTPYWTLVSATGASCVEANIVTTAAMVWGEEALDRLGGFESVGSARPRRR